MSCLVHYIKSKLEPEEDGVVNTLAVVFPIRCPECPKSTWEQGIQDDIAARLLDEKTMVFWVQKVQQRFNPNRNLIQTSSIIRNFSILYLAHFVLIPGAPHLSNSTTMKMNHKHVVQRAKPLSVFPVRLYGTMVGDIIYISLPMH
jgi:hypothetical protein